MMYDEVKLERLLARLAGRIEGLRGVSERYEVVRLVVFLLGFFGVWGGVVGVGCWYVAGGDGVVCGAFCGSGVGASAGEAGVEAA